MKVRPLVEGPLFCYFDVHTDHDLMTTRQTTLRILTMA